MLTLKSLLIKRAFPYLSLKWNALCEDIWLCHTVKKHYPVKTPYKHLAGFFLFCKYKQYSDREVTGQKNSFSLLTSKSSPFKHGKLHHSDNKGLIYPSYSCIQRFCIMSMRK